MKAKKYLLPLLLSLIIAAWFGRHYLSLGTMQHLLNSLQYCTAAHPVLSLVLFSLLYIAVTALSVPGATPLTLLAGALFGRFFGTTAVIFSATLGATLAMLLSRFFLRNFLRQRFARQWHTVNAGIRRDGAFYLLSLRLLPVFPFFLVNILTGLSEMRIRTFMSVSFIGMLPGTLVYVNAGTALAAIRSPAEILSPQLLLAFTLLALLPLCSQKILALYRQRRRLNHRQKPKHFDRHLLIIGAGAGGLVSAYIAAMLKAKVTLIEAEATGGDCLNTGCVPSKTLLHCAAVAKILREAHAPPSDKTDFAAIMRRVEESIQRIAPHDSARRYEALGVEVIRGRGVLLNPWTVQVNERTLTGKAIIIATGASPRIPAIAGTEQTDYLSASNLWQLREQPQRLLIIGGGAMGCEMAQAFQRLGSQVTLIQRDARLLPQADPQASEALQHALRAEGTDIRLSCTTVAFTDAHTLHCRDAQGNDNFIPFDRVLFAVGRQANVTGWGRESLGLSLRENGTLKTDARLATDIGHIFAVGDVTGPYQLTHAAAHQAWYAVINALFGTFKTFRADYRTLPWCVFTDPEIAQVGLNQAQADAENIAYDISRYDFAELDRAITDNATAGFVKVLTAKKSGRIIGATVVGARAGELIREYETAMRHKRTPDELLRGTRPYPTYGEINRYTAGIWKKNRVSAQAMRLLSRYQAWRLK